MYGEGISKEGDLLDLAVSADLVRRSGSWFNYGEERIGQGRENVKHYLKENPEVAGKLEVKVRDALGLPSVAAEEVEVKEAEA